MTGHQTPALMIQGTGSNVGKSLLVAGLCRLFADRGLKVMPFKPQNMSNNAGVALDGEGGGGEIGRAQMLQARAARQPPSVHMNPVLLKPEADTGAQVVVHGRRAGTLAARDYGSHKAALLPKVLESFDRLSAGADLVLVEGAGSPAETNLRAGDIANMGFAEAADVPVVLVGDIERGGVIASLVGTHAVLDPTDRARIGGFLVNRFRGDASLFDGGVAEIVRRTGWPSYGVVPHFAGADRLPAEDVLGLDSAATSSGAGRPLRIAVPRLSRIANFDDLDPLRQTPGVDVDIVPPGRALPGDAALVIIPGSKATIADLALIVREGWDVDIAAHLRRGGRALGLCGGYQMLGRSISDPDGIEGPPATVAGLGLLDVETVLTADKTTLPVAGTHAPTGLPIAGYEIHCGRTGGPDTGRPFAVIDGRADGATSPDGRVVGTYMHGVFADDGFRGAFLAGLGGEGGAASGSFSYVRTIEATLDGLAAHLADHCDVDGLLRLARTRQGQSHRPRQAG